MLLAAAGVSRSGAPALAAGQDRLVSYLVQACAAPAAGPLPDPPPPRDLYRALEISRRAIS